MEQESSVHLAPEASQAGTVAALQGHAIRLGLVGDMAT
jgi:hypothetical protein